MAYIKGIIDFLNDNDKYTIFGLLLITVIIILLFIYITIDFIVDSKRKEKNKNRKYKTNENLENKKDRKPLAPKFTEEKLYEKDKALIINHSENNLAEKIFIKDKKFEAIENEKKEPVIVIDDVCMDFHVATENVSGLKELFIKAIKGKISYRVLHALDHVSFNVYPGEVVGIIGTNGSGKSTLLKIVSGALNPTSGRVIVDRSKVQLLTLGTGFDMELTAKENVYLNGAIIGYSQEFIDENYDKIVEFAELEDFMEEKVKNFSSGMVSRLGFAIATAGEAAEILILDEVLSVGDEFFRKKSLARIKEMIHGGSTVLMVSHNMDTIRNNCNKAVWIEKGKIEKMGFTKIVCDGYQLMNKGN